MSPWNEERVRHELDIIDRQRITDRQVAEDLRQNLYFQVLRTIAEGYTGHPRQLARVALGDL